MIKAGSPDFEGARSPRRAGLRSSLKAYILQDVRQRVRDGALLSEALTAQGSFPPVYVTVIAAGERSGNLTGVIDQYISYLRVSTGFGSALLTALIYPAILVATVIVVLSYLLTYAMPQFSKLYQDLGVPLPAITQFMLNMAVPLRNYFFVFAGFSSRCRCGRFLVDAELRGSAGDRPPKAQGAGSG